MLFDILFFNDTITFKSAIILLVMTAIIFAVSLTVHEFAHSLVAYKMGDPTPKLAGRLTLNPMKHIDPMGFACFMMFGIGWAKPVAVNPLNFKKYKTGTRLVSIAGVIANVLLGLVCAVLYAILRVTIGPVSVFMSYVFLILEGFMLVNSFLAILNFLPIYPLDGFNFVASFLKPDSKFIRSGVMNGFRILFGVLLISTVVMIITQFNFIDWLFSLLYNYVFMPIAFLGA